MGGLGHAVGLQHRSAEAFLQLVKHRRRQGRAARADEAQAAARGVVLVGPAQENLMDRRHRGVPGDAVLRRDLPERAGGELRGNHHGPAGVQRGQRRADQAVDVKERHDDQAAVARRELIGGRDVGDRRHQVAVRERHAFGPAGGAAGVQEQGDVVRRRRRSVGIRCGLAALPPHEDLALGIKAAFPDRNLQLARGFAGGMIAWRHDDRLGAGVFQVEAKLLDLVSRIERRGDGTCPGRGQESDEELQVVGQDDGDWIACLDASLRRAAVHGLDLVLQLAVG